MADELGYLTINQAGDSWVDDEPDLVSTGYQAQNTNIEARNLGQDDTSINISGTSITLDSSGVIDDDGIPIVINTSVTLPIPSNGDWYIKVIAGATSTTRSLTLQNGAGTWDTSKQGYYDTGDRVLNWRITRFNTDVKLFKRSKPSQGLDLDGNLRVDEIGTDKIVTIDLETGDIQSDTGAIDTLIANTVNTGQGANELYPMNQSVKTTDIVQFDKINTGQGNNELYGMDQDVKTTDSVTFNTINTGQGNNELYGMNQSVKTTDSVTFNDLELNGNLTPTTTPGESSTATLTTDSQTITLSRGVYSILGTITNSGGSGTIDLQRFIDSGWYSIYAITTSGSTKTEMMTDTVFSSGSDLRLILSSTGTTSASAILRAY